MSFNKCFIKKENILSIYNIDGLNGIIEYLNNRDSFISSDKWCDELIELYSNNKLEEKYFTSVI